MLCGLGPPNQKSWLRLCSRTHFEVLGLDLKAYRSSKMPCPQERTALFFDLLKMGQGHDLFFLRLKLRRKFEIFLRKDLFFWRTLARCVLGLWPWPRAFLSLASRESILGKSVVNLGFFSYPWSWPWPRALYLDSTSDYLQRE